MGQCISRRVRRRSTANQRVKMICRNRVVVIIREATAKYGQRFHWDKMSKRQNRCKTSHNYRPGIVDKATVVCLEMHTSPSVGGGLDSVLWVPSGRAEILYGLNINTSSRPLRTESFNADPPVMNVSAFIVSLREVERAVLHTHNSIFHFVPVERS